MQNKTLLSTQRFAPVFLFWSFLCLIFWSFLVFNRPDVKVHLCYLLGGFEVPPKTNLVSVAKKIKFGFRCQENFHLMQNYMPKHRRSWMSGCVRRAEVLASLSPTQNLHRGFNSTKGMACWWRGRVRRTLWWGSGINPSVLGKCRVWHGVAGNASCSLQYTLVGSQHCPLLLVPSAASGRRPHGRWRRLSGKGLWHATMRVVTPVFPTATLCMTVQLYARLLAVGKLAFLFQMQMPHEEQPLNVLCLFFLAIEAMGGLEGLGVFLVAGSDWKELNGTNRTSVQ